MNSELNIKQLTSCTTSSLPRYVERRGRQKWLDRHKRTVLNGSAKSSTYVARSLESSRSVETGSKCIDVGLKRNKDGYIRVRIGSRTDGTRTLKFLHQLVWEEVNGSIPTGMEIHHKCNTRHCSNINHLECLDGSEHTALTNRQRKKRCTDGIR